jgi:hypothetical protein
LVQLLGLVGFAFFFATVLTVRHKSRIRQAVVDLSEKAGATDALGTNASII